MRVKLPVTIVFLFISLAALWLFGHLVVKRRFTALKTNLSDTYRSAIAVPTDSSTAPQLVALCIDLIRKEHSAVPFTALNDHEKKMVLHAQAVEDLPTWMSRYAAIWLSPANRKLIGQLRLIKASRPDQPKQHFGAIKRQQQLRSAIER